MNVPLSWVRADTLQDRHRKAGYVVLNDLASGSHEVQPVLGDRWLTHPILGNLTVGYFSGQGNAADGCSSRLDFIRNPRGVALSDSLKAWVSKHHISGQDRPNLQQGIDLLQQFIPLEYGPDVARVCLMRLWTRVTTEGKVSGSKANGPGQKSFVDSVLAHFRSSGAFDRARPTSGPSVVVPALASPAPVKDNVPAPTTPININYPLTPTQTAGAGRGKNLSTTDPFSTPLYHRSAADAREARIRVAENNRLREDLDKEAAIRAAADAAEAKARAAEAETRAAEDNSLRKQIADAKAALADRQAAVEKKVQDEGAALQQEVLDRSTSVAKEARTRAAENKRIEASQNSAIQQEALSRSTSDAKEARIRAAEGQRMQEQITALDSKVATLDQSIMQEATTRESRIRAEAAIRDDQIEKLRKHTIPELQALLDLVSSRMDMLSSRMDMQEKQYEKLRDTILVVLKDMWATKQASAANN